MLFDLHRLTRNLLRMFQSYEACVSICSVVSTHVCIYQTEKRIPFTTRGWTTYVNALRENPNNSKVNRLLASYILEYCIINFPSSALDVSSFNRDSSSDDCLWSSRCIVGEGAYNEKDGKVIARREKTSP